MGDFLSLLGMGATAKTRADAAQLEGADIRRQREQKDLLAAIQQQRQAAQDAQGAEMFGLQKRNILDQIRERNEAPVAQAPARRTQIVDGQLVDMDTGTATAIQGYKAPEPKPPTAAGGTFTQFTGPDGKPVFFNPTTQASVSAPDGFTPPSPRTGLPTEAERKAAGLLLTGENGYKTLQSLLGQPEDNPATPEREDEAPGKSAPGWLNRQASKVGLGVGNIVSPDELRQIDQASYDLSEAWLRLTSGAAIGRDEIVNSAKAIIPQPGDDDATRTQKARSRRLRIEALRQAAGRATDPNVRGTAAPNDPYAALITPPPGGAP